MNGRVLPGECTEGGENSDIIYNEYDAKAEAALTTQYLSTIGIPANTIVSFPSAIESGVPFQWIVVQNLEGLWKVTSSDIAKGYNSQNTGAILYKIEHSGSSISGATVVARVRRWPSSAPLPTLVNLSWTETFADQRIANDYKSGSITVSGQLKNWGITFETPTNWCTVTVQ